MTDTSLSASLVPPLRRALRHLYDQVELGTSPLIELLGLAQRKEPSLALRRLLMQTIASLKPDSATPPQSVAWRVYEVLSQRYVEQLTQREVATDLGLSIRQLQRQERRALRLLSEALCAREDLQHEVAAEPAVRRRMREAREGEGGASSREWEMEWLRKTTGSGPVSAMDAVEAAVGVARPLADSLKVSIENDLPDSLPPLAAKPAVLRQALLLLLTAAIHCVPEGLVKIEAGTRQWQQWVEIRSVRRQAITPPITREQRGSLAVARQLVSLINGSLKVTADEQSSTPFTARMMMPSAELLPVLVVDDNADTLRLFKRFLAGSRYRFIGLSKPKDVIAVIEETTPRVIILDVMLPGIDGWELLGRLRAHPLSSDVPVIVCTILPQEQLALSLGAAAFLLKPISRSTLLSTLDRQADSSARECQ